MLPLLSQRADPKNLNKLKLDAFLAEYGLSNKEGVALMCLAESLLRIPDNKTRDELIQEKLSHSKWKEHLNKSGQPFSKCSDLGSVDCWKNR